MKKGDKDTRSRHDSGISGMMDMMKEMNGDESGNKQKACEEFRLAWMWVEGWRARLRMSGDVVEKERHVWDIVKSRAV